MPCGGVLHVGATSIFFQSDSRHTLASLQEVIWGGSRHWAELEAAHVQQVNEVCGSSCSWDG